MTDGPHKFDRSLEALATLRLARPLITGYSAVQYTYMYTTLDAKRCVVSDVDSYSMKRGTECIYNHRPSSRESIQPDRNYEANAGLAGWSRPPLVHLVLAC